MDVRPRVSFDTNLWSRIGDQGESAAFETLVDHRQILVVVPPSTLMEVLRLPAPEPRRRIIAALTARPRLRLSSEAQLESDEVIAEARRTRPAWCRAMPDTARIASLNAFWTKGVWRSAVDRPETLHAYLKRESDPVRSLVFQAQRRQRREVVSSGFDITRLGSLKATAKPDSPLDYKIGWDGSPVDLWRIQSRDIYWHHLATVARRAETTNEDTTYADWIGAALDLSRVTFDRADFTRFWLQDVELTAMPRNWLRWAVQTVQRARQVTPGDPADAQHSAYLVDCDIYLTADIPYANSLITVREHAPFPMAEPRIVRYDPDASIVGAIASAFA